MVDAPDILVTRQKPHGLPAESLASTLADTVPAHSVSMARTTSEERTLIEDADVVVGDSITEESLDAAEELSLFACSFAGYEHLPLESFEKRDIAVTNASGVHASNVAEHAVGGLLALTRGLLTARRHQRNREWRNFQVDELAGSTVTVVGMGAIGRAICQRLQGFDVELVGVRNSPEKDGPADSIVGYDDLDSALAAASAVILACPLTNRTRHMFDREAFRTMHPDAVLVNVARGGVVVTDALVQAIRANHIGGAALDVTDPEPLPPDHPLWTFENVLVTPHNAGHTPRYYERLAAILEENVEHAMETGEWRGLKNQVLP